MGILAEMALKLVEINVEVCPDEAVKASSSSVWRDRSGRAISISRQLAGD